MKSTIRAAKPIHINECGVDDLAAPKLTQLANAVVPVHSAHLGDPTPVDDLETWPVVDLAAQLDEPAPVLDALLDGLAADGVDVDWMRR